MLLRGLDPQVLPPERDDPQVVATVGVPGQAIGLEASAEHEPLDDLGTVATPDGDAARDAAQTGDLRREQQLTAGGSDVLSQRPGHRDEVGDRGLRGVQRGQTCCVWLEVADPRRIEPSEAGDPVLRGGAVQRVEPVQLGLVDGHYELAARLVGNRVLGTVLAEQPSAPRAQPRLEAPRAVVDAGVDHT
jgi:hypothetical protein